jgi:predicted transcriptional regulator of viral defense system
MLIMNQAKKLKLIANLSYFDKNTLLQIIDLNDNSLYANIKRWLKNGLLIQLKKGYYVTHEYYDRLADKESYHAFISNKLREPSYLSLEYVLQKHGVITEAVYVFTSITLKSRRIYNNQLGTFFYRNIQQKLFTGYEIYSYGNFEIKEASKAKALFDYLYLKLYRIFSINKALLASIRLNLDEFTKKDFDEFLRYCVLSEKQNLLGLTELLSKEIKGR